MPLRLSVRRAPLTTFVMVTCWTTLFGPEPAVAGPDAGVIWAFLTLPGETWTTVNLARMRAA